jgi:hypothetical protein
LHAGFATGRQQAVTLQMQQRLGEQFFQMFFHAVIFPCAAGEAGDSDEYGKAYCKPLRSAE